MRSLSRDKRVVILLSAAVQMASIERWFCIDNHFGMEVTDYLART